jgi:hypothetical protein
MTRLFWGCDIAGGKNTGLASVRQVGGVWQVHTPDAAGLSPLGITQLIWQDAQKHSGFPVVYLVIDAPLSQNLGCPASWRPVDGFSRRNANLNWTMSPNRLQGHRGRELAESFGAYFVVAETNPRPCMSLMGADKELLSKYKEEGKEGREACNGLSYWLANALSFDGWQANDNNALDATVCAAVAAAMAGVEYKGFELIAPVLGNAEDREFACLENPQQCIPSAVLVGTAPFLFLRKQESKCGENNSLTEEEPIAHVPEIPDAGMPQAGGIGVAPFVCPIPGCNHVYARGRLGWDGHINNARHRGDWHPNEQDEEARKDIFRKDFPGFFE